MSTLHFDHRMSEALHMRLCNYLQLAIEPGQCDGRLTWTARFLREHHRSIPDGAAWLRDHGASCDCEVIVKTVPWDRTLPFPPVPVTAHSSH